MFKERNNPTTIVKAIPSKIPQIIISADALAQMQVYTETCNDEIGWLGTVTPIQGGYFIQDVYLFEQEVHATTTEITPEGLQKFAEELLQQEDGMEIWNNLRMWGHSHVNMPVNPSAQDDKQMNQFAQTGQDFFIRIITNKKGELRVDVYNYKEGIQYLDVPWTEYASESEYQIRRQINDLENDFNMQIKLLEDQLKSIQEQRVNQYKPHIEAEIKEKVSKLVVTYKANGYSQFNQKKTTTQTQTLIPSSTTTKTNTNGTTYIQTGLEDFEEPFQLIYTKENHFTFDHDVYKEFKEEELREFASCISIADLEMLLKDYGYDCSFSKDDVARINRVAYESFTRK